MEEVLGLPPMNLNDALSQPMADIFNTYRPSGASRHGSSRPLLHEPAAHSSGRPGGAQANPYGRVLGVATKGMDFTSEDRMDFAEYNTFSGRG